MSQSVGESADDLCWDCGGVKSLMTKAEFLPPLFVASRMSINDVHEKMVWPCSTCPWIKTHQNVVLEVFLILNVERGCSHFFKGPICSLLRGPWPFCLKSRPEKRQLMDVDRQGQSGVCWTYSVFLFNSYLSFSFSLDLGRPLSLPCAL